MGVFRLERGLLVQRGDRKIAFQRQIDGETVQFEDILTGQLELHKISTFLRNVNAGVYTICGATDGAAQPANIKVVNDEKVGVMVLTLRDHQRIAWERKCGYVYALRRYGVRRGQKNRIAQLLPAIAERLKDKDPPSAWTVMKWLRKFESDGSDNTSLVSGNALRPGKARIDAEFEELIRSVLRKHYFIRNGESLHQTYSRVKAQVQLANGQAPVLGRSVSESTVRRIAKETDPYHRDRARFGAAFAAAKWRHSTGGVYATRPMQRVEMDHTTLDLYVIDDKRGIPLGRPMITMLIDGYSSYILSIYVSFEGGSLGRMAQAIKFALQPKDELVQSLDLNQQ